VFNSSNISETNGRYAKAQISKSFELPGEECEPYVAESKNSCWSKALILQYLREHCNNVVHESTRMRPKDDDDEVGYKCLQKLLLKHWQENQFTVERLAILLQYVKDNKTASPVCGDRPTNGRCCYTSQLMTVSVDFLIVLL
jgi:hypothetical protein